MIQDSLKTFGLTDKEITIYLGALKLGEATAHQISTVSHSNRPYCYEVLESLKQQGLIATNTKNNTKYYHAVHPEKIRDLMKEKEAQVLKAIPQLSSMFNVIGNLPKTEIFEGIEGVKTILSDLVRSGEDACIYGSAEKQAEFLKHHFPQYIRRRSERKVFARVIVEKSEFSKELKKNDSKDYRELRFFNRPVDFATATHIYGNKVAIFSFTGTYFGIIIENEQVAKTQQFIFDMLWDSADTKISDNDLKKPKTTTKYPMIKEEIKKLVNKENIILTKRGNESIKSALQIAKGRGYTKCYILDQGGWITYPQFIEKLKLEQITIKTDDCKINLSELEQTLDDKSILLIHSLSGYWYKQPMAKIEQICKEKGSLLICDVAGSIFDKKLIKGDIIIGSFGRWKPIDNHSGGFIATEENLDDYLEINSPSQLLTKIKEVKDRTEFLNQTSLKIINEVKENKLNVLNNLENNSDMNYVVVAPFNTEKEKEILLKIAEKFKVEANECPREIRSLRNAISFEVKKL